MPTVLVNNDQYQIILLLLKYLSSDKDTNSIDENYQINVENFKKFLLKKALLPISVKNKLLKNLNVILDSLSGEVLFYNKANENLQITKKQICSLIRPIITNAAIKPFERQKLQEFFKAFDCVPNENEFFFEILSPPIS